MPLLAASGDVSRFPTAKKLVGSSGRGASRHSSGDTNRAGAITTEGRRELRTALVEAASRGCGTRLPTCERSSSDWPHALASAKPVWPLLANSWWSSGLS